MKKSFGLIFMAVTAGVMFSGCSSGSNDLAAGNFNTNHTISVVSREDGSGTRGAFIELFDIEISDDNGGKRDMTTKEAIIANNTSIMMTNIQNDPYAIGYISMGSLNDSIKALTIDDASPNNENVKDGSYKVARPFYIATKADVDELTKDFTDFILSAEGQAIVAETYISVDDNAQPYQGHRPEGKIVVAGSSSVAPVMEKLVEAYLSVNTNAVIEIQMSDSSSGMTGTINGICDIGMASRELRDSEKEHLTATRIAIDGIAVIVNNNNPVSSMTSNEIKDIFTGEITQWNSFIQ